MTSALAFIFFSLAVLVTIGMAWRCVRDRSSLLNLRTFFLTGFVIFQLVSAGLSFWTMTWGDVWVSEPLRTGFIYLFSCLIFLGLFNLAYNRGWWVKKSAWRATPHFPAVNPTILITLGWMFLGIGFVLRVVVGRNVAVLGVLTDILAIGVLSGAAGLAMWAWAPRFWNLAVAIPAVCIIAGSILSTVVLTFGRRDVLSVLVTTLFAAYQSHWRHQNLARLFYRLTITLGLSLFFLAGFTTARAVTAKGTNLGEYFTKFMEADVSGGLLAMATGQYAAANSMWVIENHPEPLDYFPYHSVLYTFINPIPRVVWPDKPLGLGYTMVRDAHVYRFEENFTLGPGIIGHIFYDNPWLALIPYPIFFGLLFRYFDEFIRARPGNPFIVLPVVVGSGEVIGIARGEVGLFLFRALVAMFAAWVAMRICSSLLRTFRGVQAAPDEEQSDPEWVEEEYDQELPAYP